MNEFTRIYNPHMLPKVRSKAIMAAAEGSPCTLMIASLVPNRRCSGIETTAGCHLHVPGKGVGTKVTDMAVAFGCRACHDIIDGRDHDAWKWLVQHDGARVVQSMLNGLYGTHSLLIASDIIQVPDAEII